MSPSVYIVSRKTATRGTVHHVRYRLGGREAKPQHGGVFRTRREAEERRRWISGEIAAMRIPDLRALEPPPEREPLRVWCDRFAASRIDVSDATRNQYRKAAARLGPLGELNPAMITPAQVAAWVAGLAAELRPGSVRNYLASIRQVFDFAGVVPNPARDAAVRLPRSDAREVVPPTMSQVAALISAIAPRFRLPLRVLRDTGCRIGELQAMTWGDLDTRANRWRVARGRTKGGTGGRRWIPVPADLMADLVSPYRPFDGPRAYLPGGGPDDPVFGDVPGLRDAMARTCAALGLPHMHPHSLRHLYASRLIAQGVPVTEVSYLLGHRKRSLTLDVYSHIVPPDEDG